MVDMGATVHGTGVPSRAALDRRVVGLRQADGMPRATTCKIISDRAAPLRSLVMKHLTGNQVLGDRIYSQLEPADEDTLAYISCYINGSGRP